MNEDLELYKTFFQKSKMYYVDKWLKASNGPGYTFNIFAFLFGLFWLMYRKMYLEALIVLGVIIAESYLENLLLPKDIGEETRQLTNVVATITIGTVLGFCGNKIYLRKAAKQIEIAKTKFEDYEQQKSFLSKKGGVSYSFLIILLLLAVVIFVYSRYGITSIG